MEEERESRTSFVLPFLDDQMVDGGGRFQFPNINSLFKASTVLFPWHSFRLEREERITTKRQDPQSVDVFFYRPIMSVNWRLKGGACV